MHRTQLLLDDWLFQALRAQARGSGRSISDIVREIVSAHLALGARRAGDRLHEVEGVSEGPPDLGGSHDSYLYGAAAPAEAPPVRRRSKRKAARP